MSKWDSHWSKHPGIKNKNLTIGEKAADALRDGMGSWTFVFVFFIFMALWAAVNSLFLKHSFDPYPYILLNLFLSMLAAVQASALLIAAKRADSISSEIALHTEKNTDEIKTLINENTTLTSEVKKNTELLKELLNKEDT